MAYFSFPLAHIPANNKISDTFQVELEGNEYEMTIKWQEYNQAWYLDVSGLSNDIEINGIKVVGEIDLLKSYGYGNTLGSLFMVDYTGRKQNADYAGLGDRFRLIYRSLQ
jgi:hypothetical protein